MSEDESLSSGSRDDFRINLHQSKRIKMTDDGKAQKCRERNRIHARNTRERKRMQLDLMQKRIEELYDEKACLSKQLLDTTVAGILITLSSQENESNFSDFSGDFPDSMARDSKYKGLRSLDEVKARISQELSDYDDHDMECEFPSKDKSSYTSQELDVMRRERNRMHAKRTRLRKKKMLQEMESLLVSLDAEVLELKNRVQNFADANHLNNIPASATMRTADAMMSSRDLRDVKGSKSQNNKRSSRLKDKLKSKNRSDSREVTFSSHLQEKAWVVYGTRSTTTSTPIQNKRTFGAISSASYEFQEVGYVDLDTDDDDDDDSDGKTEGESDDRIESTRSNSFECKQRSIPTILSSDSLFESEEKASNLLGFLRQCDNISL